MCIKFLCNTIRTFTENPVINLKNCCTLNCSIIRLCSICTYNWLKIKLKFSLVDQFKQNWQSILQSITLKVFKISILYI